MSMTKLETWNVLGRVDAERFSGSMQEAPWDLSHAKLFHLPLGALDLSGDNLKYANLQQSELNGANLANADLSNVFLQDAWVTGASLTGANMGGANLGGCKLYGSDLSKTNLRFASIYGTDMRGVSLRGAVLSQAMISGGRWDDVDLMSAKFGYTTLANMNLSKARNLETITHDGPSTVGMDTIIKSGGNIPDKFLLGCGLPQEIITHVHSIFESQLENKVFLSYTFGKDDHWVEKLAFALNARGIFVFFDKWDIKPGDSITKFMESGIDQSKFGLFVCTPESVERADSETRWTGYEAIQFKVGLVESNKRIIPILRAGTEVPRYLRGRRWVDMRDDDKFVDRVTEISNLVLGMPVRPRLGTPPMQEGTS